MSKIIGIVFLFILLNFSIFPQNFWEKINSPTSKTLNSIVFLDSLNGWVAGDYIDIASVNDVVCPLWIDRRTGDSKGWMHKDSFEPSCPVEAASNPVPANGAANIPVELHKLHGLTVQEQ